jgi:hypothetical protein
MSGSPRTASTRWSCGSSARLAASSSPPAPSTVAGRALVSATSAACARPAGAAIRGALVARGAALVASDAGLVRHPLVANGPPTLFAETEPHVVREAPIAACPRGVLVAAGAALKLLSIATRTH